MRPILFHFFISILTSAIGYAQTAPDSFIQKLSCAHTEKVTGGTLCVINPQSLNSEATESQSGLLKRNLGFGSHVLAIPDDLSEKTQVIIHFVGTFGRPYNERKGKYAVKDFYLEALKKNLFMISLAYDNTSMINGRKACNKKGQTIDNCAYKARMNKFNASVSFERGQTPLADTIENRLNLLISHFEKANSPLSTNAFKWKNLFVSGHSQGGGMSLFIASYIGVKHACLIAGGYDVPDKVGGENPFADWIMNRPQKTELKNIKALVHKKDKFYDRMKSVYEYLKLDKIDNLIVVDSENSNGHKAVMKSPLFKKQRAEACFSL